MGGLVGSAPACSVSSLCSNPDIYQKYKMSNISKEVANILYPAKKKIYQRSIQTTGRKGCCPPASMVRIIAKSCNLYYLWRHSAISLGILNFHSLWSFCILSVSHLVSPGVSVSFHICQLDICPDSHKHTICYSSDETAIK
jgi:hypothetical protein